MFDLAVFRGWQHCQCQLSVLGKWGEICVVLIIVGTSDVDCTTIDKHLRISGQVKKAAAAAKVAPFKLRPLLRSTLPLRTKLAFYKLFVRPHLTYATPAWHALASASQRKIMQVVQNIALRHVTQAPYFVRNSTLQRDLRIESLEEHRPTICQRF